MGELLDPPIHGCLYAWMLNFRKQIQANKVCVYIYIEELLYPLVHGCLYDWMLNFIMQI